MDVGQDQVLGIVKLAERELGRKNYAAADLLCHEALARQPGQARAAKILARLKGELGLTAGVTATGAGPRYLLIKAWGYGFWSDMTQVLGCLLLAEITGRIPVVHWGRESLFRAEQGDAFHLFWDPVSAATLDDVARAMAGGVFPDKWSPANIDAGDVAKWQGPGSRLGGVNVLNRSEAVVVSDFFINPLDVAPWIPEGHPLHGQGPQAVFPYLAGRYLRPCQAVGERVAAFRAEHLSSGDVLAVHLRASDKSTEYKANELINNHCVELMDAEPEAVRFFVLTDDARWLAFLAQRYGPRLIHTTCQRTSTLTGTHYLEDIDRTALGREVMVDTYLALGCERFLGNGRSSLSNIVTLLKPWPAGACRIVEPLILTWRNVGLHMADEGAAWNALIA